MLFSLYRKKKIILWVEKICWISHYIAAWFSLLVEQGFPTCGPRGNTVRPAKSYGLIVLAELMKYSRKYWNQKVLYYDLRLNYSTVVANIMGLLNKILRKIYKTFLILLHAARLQTWLTGVRPAVDLSWKALL